MAINYDDYGTGREQAENRRAEIAAQKKDLSTFAAFQTGIVIGRFSFTKTYNSRD